MKVEINEKGTFHQFQPDDYTFGNSSHPHKLVDIKGFSFDHEKDEDFLRNHSIDPSGVSLFSIDESGIVHKKDQAEIKSNEKYRENFLCQVKKLIEKKMLWEKLLSDYGSGFPAQVKQMISRKIKDLDDKIVEKLSNL